MEMKRFSFPVETETERSGNGNATERYKRLKRCKRYKRYNRSAWNARNGRNGKIGMLVTVELFSLPLQTFLGHPIIYSNIPTVSLYEINLNEHNNWLQFINTNALLYVLCRKK